MEFEDLLVIGTFLFVIIVILVVLGAFILVSGFIASALGLSGIMWWAVAIVSFMILTTLAGGLTIRAKD